MLCASLSMGETKLYPEKGNWNGRKSLLNEKWLKNPGVLGNKKRNVNEGERTARKLGERGKMCHSERQSWDQSRASRHLKGPLGEIIIQRIRLYDKAAAVGYGEVDMRPGLGRKEELLRKIDS